MIYFTLLHSLNPNLLLINNVIISRLPAPVIHTQIMNLISKKKKKKQPIKGPLGKKSKSFFMIFNFFNNYQCPCTLSLSHKTTHSFCNPSFILSFHPNKFLISKTPHYSLPFFFSNAHKPPPVSVASPPQSTLIL